LRLDFDRRLLLQFRGSAITSDAGLLPYRELDDAVGLTDTGADTLADARTGKNGRHRLAGYEDVNDAERLCRDPARRWVVGDRAISGSAASASQMGRFETKWLSRPENLAALADLPGQWIDKVHQRRPPRVILLDMDSSESPTYGEQEGSAYNGHFGCTCYHPLFAFNQLGDVERRALRSGNVHSADGWRAVLEPVVARYRGVVKRVYFRGDAAFANPEMHEFLEAERIGYTIRLPANRVLQDRIGYLLKRPVGRPPHEVRCYFASFSYQAQSWNKSRRVVAKVEWHPNELYPRVGFIVTNLARSAERVVAFYNQRGTAEQWIKEGKGAVNGHACCAAPSPPTPCVFSSTPSPTILAISCGRWRCPKRAESWSLTSLKEKLIKIGAKVVSHGRYVTFQLAEVAVPRQMFQEILSLIARLQAPPAPVRGALGQMMRQATTAKGRLDAGKAERFSASARHVGYFDRLLRTQAPICPCPRRPKGRSLPRKEPESGECRLKLEFVTV